MLRFVVLAFGRSGSTWLVNELNGHPDVVCYHEYFAPDRAHRMLHRLGVVPFVEEIYERGVAAPLARWLRNLAGNEVRAYTPRHHGRKRSVGFKVTVAQTLHAWPDLWAWIQDADDVCIVLLRRRNTIRRFLSYELARRSGVWHARRSSQRRVDRIHVDLDRLQAFCDLERRELTTIEAVRQRASDRWLDVTYEELLAGPGAWREVFRFVGCTDAVELREKTARLAPAQIQDFVVNYTELAAWAGRSGLERQLSDAQPQVA